MGWTALYIALILIGAGLLVVFGKAMPAHAVDGGDGGGAGGGRLVVFKQDSWSETRSYAAPNNVGAGTHIETYVGTLNTKYLFWPDGDSVNKIAVAQVEFCWRRTQGNGALFQGMNANPNYHDDNDSVPVGAFLLDDNGNSSRCKTYMVPDEDRQWFRMDQSPAWTATGKLRIKFSPDQDYNYTWGGSTTKFFHPGDDPELADWFVCYNCDYGGKNH